MIISGCSGGGKSTLLAEFCRRGYSVVEEPGRRIIKEETDHGGQAVPWIDMTAFLRRNFEMALADRASASTSERWVFFDRGVVDAAVALQEMTGEPLINTLGQSFRYHRRVFLAPPWPEIFEQDPGRRHDMHAALAEYSSLLRVYPMLRYEVLTLPKIGVSERADFVLNALDD